MFLSEEMRNILNILTRPVISIMENRVVIRKMRKHKRPSRSDVQFCVPGDLKLISENYKSALSIFLYISSRIDNACLLKIVHVFFLMSQSFLEGVSCHLSVKNYYSAS